MVVALAWVGVVALGMAVLVGVVDLIALAFLRDAKAAGGDDA